MSVVYEGWHGPDSAEPQRREPVWEQKRTKWFHMCMDTQKTIWPLEKAYYTDAIGGANGIEIRTPSVGRWITNKAYVYRVLKGKENAAIYMITDVNMS